jgi:hypothetical protein
MSSKEVVGKRCNSERQKESGQEFLPASAASTAKWPMLLSVPV